MERLKIELRNAAWEIESGNDEENRSSEWGLLKLCKENKFRDKARNIDQLFNSKKRTVTRLVPVSKLFEEEPEQPGKTKVSKSKTKNVVR